MFDAGAILESINLLPVGRFLAYFAKGLARTCLAFAMGFLVSEILRQKSVSASTYNISRMSLSCFYYINGLLLQSDTSQLRNSA